MYLLTVLKIKKILMKFGVQWGVQSSNKSMESLVVEQHLITVGLTKEQNKGFLSKTLNYTCIGKLWLGRSMYTEIHVTVCFSCANLLADLCLFPG